MTRRAIAVLVLATAGCPRVDFDNLIFQSDAGAREDAAVIEDAGLADAGILDEDMRCVRSIDQHGETASWWCVAGTPDELDAFAALHDLSIIQLEIEPIETARRVAAVLIPNDGLYRSWNWQLIRELDEDGDAVHPELRGTGLYALDFEPYPSGDGDSALAAVFTSRAYGCSRFPYGYAGATIEQINAWIENFNATRFQTISFEPFIFKRREHRYISMHGVGTSTIVLDAHGVDIATMLGDERSILRTFHSTNNAARFDAVIGERTASDRRSVWVRELLESELVEMTSSSSTAHVRRIDVNSAGPRRRFAALFVDNATVAGGRPAESARFSAMLSAGTNGADVGVYLKEWKGDALIAYNARRPIFAKQMLAPLIAAHILNEAERVPPPFLLDDPIDIPPRGCETSTVVARTESLRDAVRGMLAGDDAARATALVDRFGLTALQKRALPFSMPETTLAVPPGCDTAEVSSKTTLLDQAMLYEYTLHCVLSGSFVTDFRAWLPGERTGVDPEGFDGVLDQLTNAEADRVGLPPAGRGEFVGEAQVIYTSSDVSEPASGVVRRAIAGRVRVPRCVGTADDFAIYFFGFFIEGAADAASAEAALDAVKRELLIEPVRRGVSWGGIACLDGR